MQSLVVHKKNDDIRLSKYQIGVIKEAMEDHEYPFVYLQRNFDYGEYKNVEHTGVRVREPTIRSLYKKGMLAIGARLDKELDKLLFLAQVTDKGKRYYNEKIKERQ